VTAPGGFGTQEMYAVDDRLDLALMDDAVVVIALPVRSDGVQRLTVFYRGDDVGGVYHYWQALTLCVVVENRRRLKEMLLERLDAILDLLSGIHVENVCAGNI